MASGLKVRLDDGSEVGPLDLPMVRSWYEQGLIGPESPVQRAGSKNWTKLAQAVDLRSWGNLAVPSKKAVRSKAKGAAGGRGSGREAAPTGRSGPSFADHWATAVSGGLLAAAAGAFAYLHFHAEDTVPPLDRAPFSAIALGLLAAALALLPGWEMSRKIVRLLAVGVAVAVFPLLGILVAQGVRGTALLALGALALFFGALFTLLADPAPPWTRAALRILGVLAAGAATGYFAYAPETEAQRLVRESVTSERRFDDASLGLSLELPEGWRLLKKDAEAFTQPADARVAFAHPRQEAFGFLSTASSPTGVASLEAWLNRVLGERRRTQPTAQEESRTDVAVGTLTGRRATLAWSASGVPHREVATVWRDGWIYYALVAWAPASAGATDLDALTSGVATSGKLAANLQAAVQKVTLEVPALTAAAAEMLMARSEARVLEPDQAFRRSFDALAQALPTWKAGEAQEMARLISACYATLSARERSLLAAYVEKVQKHQMTSPQEDRDMGQLMKAAVLRLPAAKRERLQALYQRAVEAAVAG